jgi:predicted nucleic acid-binding protein
MYLLDTNVLSEMRKSGKAHPQVRRWAASVDAASLFLSVISIFEMEMGIRRMERRDRAQGSVLRSWLHTKILSAFQGRILPIDAEIAVRCAALHVPDPRSYRDSFIAATALAYDMTVVTRNITDFKAMGVALLNPWEP